MNSKEALERLYDNLNCEVDSYYYDIEAHKDKEIIEQDLDRLEKLEKENEELKNTILSLELDTCIPELRKENQELRKSIKSWNENAGNLLKENAKLKKVIKILEDNLQLVIVQDIDPFFKKKIYSVALSQFYKKYSGFEVTQEQYELLKEVLNGVD